MTGSAMISFIVGEASPANTFFAIWMAEAAGLFEHYGLALEIVKMIGGSETGPALSDGQIQLMHIGMSSVVRANARGFNVVTIGSLSNVIRSTLFAAPGITSPEELMGQVIGISSVGSESELSTLVALERLGLSRHHVTLEEIGTLRLPYIRDGKVAASMLGEPYRSEAMAEGIHVLSDMLVDGIPWLYSGLVVEKNYLTNNRDTVLRALRAIIEGNYMAVTEPAHAKKVMAQVLDITNTKNLNITYDNFREYTPMNTEVTREGAKAIIATVDAPGASRNLDDYIDESLHEELKNEGFFKLMVKKYGYQR